uniref:Protein TPX2 n=1 Tax=Davidia involucrata TaxID=16924 RepID=A0A5B7AV34_DAVIN
MAVVDDSNVFIIDETYEFSAPRFFDFINGESEEDMRKAELWFDTALSCAPSPFMPRIKTGRSVQLESLCDFTEAEQLQKPSESSETTTKSNITKESTKEPEKDQTRPPMAAEVREGEVAPTEAKEELGTSLVNLVSVDKNTCEAKEGTCTQESGSASSTMKVEVPNDKDNDNLSAASVGAEACTPKPPTISPKVDLIQTDSKKHQAAKNIARMVRNPSALKSKNQLQLSQAKSIKPASVRRDTNVKNTVRTPNFAQENQAIKRQKLEGGRSRQILHIKTQNLPHKSRTGLVSSSTTSTVKSRKEQRKVYVREPAPPFVSMAEMMKKFQSNTREISLPHMSSSSLSHDAAASIMQRKPKLTLTRPKEPEFETAQRVRSVRVKSSAELEEEMMAKIPKFKARPLNKKIMEAPTLPALPRSTPHLPEFQEFHLETMSRANQNAETSTVASTESAQNHQWKLHLTAPKTPLLQTSLRARPPRIKSSVELEKEELEKVPKFKARPLNKKIFESKGDLGIFCNTKRQHITVPQEFHFATDERIPPPVTVADLFDKLSLNSEPHHDKQLPRNTTPNPFRLHTEERGTEKERKFVMEVIEKQLEEERARIPKAYPYPYTTDYPVIPPKPEPKQCTKPEPFQLENLTRHEEEMQKEMEERQRMEKEEAQMRIFKAQPILKEDPIPVPEKVRKPLTQVQKFNLHVDHRAVDRAEFDKKIKDKEIMYKRYRDEAETEKMMEEEKALKQLRRTLVPHARPVPNFDKFFIPQRCSKEITKPKSPNLQVVRRKERRKMVSVVAATSTAASHMR